MSAEKSRNRSVRAASVSQGDDAVPRSQRRGRGYSWPPFEPGNLVSVRHGIYSARLVRPVAERVKAGLLATSGLEYLDSPMFAPRLDAYAWAAAQCELVEAWLAGLSWESATDGTDGRMPPLELSRLLSRRADRLGARCGLAPVLDDDVAADIAVAREQIVWRLLGGTNEWKEL